MLYCVIEKSQVDNYYNKVTVAMAIPYAWLAILGLLLYLNSIDREVYTRTTQFLHVQSNGIFFVFLLFTVFWSSFFILHSVPVQPQLQQKFPLPILHEAIACIIIILYQINMHYSENFKQRKKFLQYCNLHTFSMQGTDMDSCTLYT